MARERRELIGLRLHPNALNEAKRVAQATGMTLADVLRGAVAAGLPLVEQRAKEPKA